MIWALIPVKAFDNAKSRLRAVLSAAECSALALNMARDVAAAVRGADAVHGLTLLGGGPDIRELATTLGCEYIEEFPEVDLSGNLNVAARQLAATGVNTLIILPGDLPTLRAADVADLIADTPAGLALCPAGRDGGTNALIVSPPDAIPFHFGVHSARRHLEAARDAGINSREIPHRAFNVDIDTPDDLIWLCRQGNPGFTAEFLDRSGIRTRILETETALPV
jgi:2-phospho-L-lactate guanylyltransferase